MTDRAGLLPPKDAVAVIFLSTRRDDDRGEAYGAAADAMLALAEIQPGYLGYDSARGSDRFGITVSYWADEASALAWKAHAEHAAIRALGREQWYADYRVIISRVEHGYGWQAQD